MSNVLSNKANKLFLILGGFFVANAMVAEMIGVKIFSLEATLGFAPLDFELFGVEGLGFDLSAGVLIWPVVFIMTDVINEYYGLKGVRFLSFMTVILLIYAFFALFFAIWLTPNEWWAFESGVVNDDPASSLSNMNLAFKKIFGQGSWIIVGSLIAFLVGQLVDVLVFQKIKQWTGEKKVWLRATGSTLISQGIDSYLVMIIAFYIGSDWDLVRVLVIASVNYSYKFLVAILLTPVIYLAHHLIDSYLGEPLATKLKTEALLKKN